MAEDGDEEDGGAADVGGDAEGEAFEEGVDGEDEGEDVGDGSVVGAAGGEQPLGFRPMVAHVVVAVAVVVVVAVQEEPLHDECEEERAGGDDVRKRDVGGGAREDIVGEDFGRLGEEVDEAGGEEHPAGEGIHVRQRPGCVRTGSQGLTVDSF